MGLFITIRDGETPASPVTADENNAMIIGKSSVIPSDNPFLASDMGKFTSYNIPTTTAVYKAAQNYFTHANGNGGLWVYVVSGAAQTGLESMLEGPRDGSNTTFYSPYSPMLTISNVEANFYSSGWEVVATGEYTTGEYDGSPDGTITFTSGITYEYTDDGTGVTGLNLKPGAADYLRATITYGPLGTAFNALLGDDMYYQFFTFAYDQSLTQPIAGGGTKFATGATYGGVSWLDDVKQAKIMAGNFNDVGKTTMFIASIPDSMKPNTRMTGEYSTGTTYATGYAYSRIRDIIGQDDNITMPSAKQATDGEDTAASFMGDCMSTAPRKTIATKTSSLAQTVFPKNDEILGWKSCNVNPLINYAGVTMWYSGKTFGVGYEQEINYKRCYGIMKKRLRDDLLTRIMRRDLKYDLAGVDSLADTIRGTMRRLQSANIIDSGTVTINIPIREYLSKEASLNDADVAYLAAQRQSQLVKDITIRFPWSGDIVFVEVSSILPN